MQRLCLSLDLRPDPALIAEYVRLHGAVWPEIRKSIYQAGVLDMQIYRLQDRLFMIMDVAEGFSLDEKARLDAANPRVLEWEALMARFQQVAEDGDATRKWQPMEKIFQLTP